MRITPGAFEWLHSGSFIAAAVFVVMSAIVIAKIAGSVPVGAQAQARTKINPKDGLTYVWVLPGTFQMGCSPDDSKCGEEEKPAHKVTITKGFWIGQTLVTQSAWKKVKGNNLSRFVGDRLPAETVSWQEAESFCDDVDMRLPTEAEWEYAARGGTSRASYAPLARIAWYDANSGGTTHEVGQKQPNAYGLYDMLGNVWEWVADGHGLYDRADAVDPKRPPTALDRVLRGSSWSNDASYVRVSNRNWLGAGVRYNFIGFRCAGN